MKGLFSFVQAYQHFKSGSILYLVSTTSPAANLRKKYAPGDGYNARHINR